ACRTPAKAGGRLPRQSRKGSPSTCSARRSSRASAPAVSPCARTSCCGRCGSHSAAMWRKNSRMAERSDALVFLGATGDLAYKKIFPPVQAMIRRGTVDVPVIAVARGGSWEQLRERARASVEEHGGGADPV